MGAWWHFPRASQSLAVQGLQREGIHGASLAHSATVLWGSPHARSRARAHTHTPLFLSAPHQVSKTSPTCRTQKSQEFQLSCPQTHLGGFFDVVPEGPTLLWKPEGELPSPLPTRSCHLAPQPRRHDPQLQASEAQPLLSFLPPSPASPPQESGPVALLHSQPRQLAPALSCSKPVGSLFSAPPRLSPEDAGLPRRSPQSQIPSSGGGVRCTARTGKGAVPQTGAGAPPGGRNGRAEPKESHLNPDQRH